MKKLRIQELKSGLSAAIAVAEGGEVILITRDGQTVAQLGPATPPGVHQGLLVGRGRLEPALQRGNSARALAVVLADRGDR
jgi:antitoxin (DNA-binding transcriptional repressor) of toxin-antitoxin stability system